MPATHAIQPHHDHEGRQADEHDHHDLVDRGLAFDLGTLAARMDRRRLLGLVGGAAAVVALAACGSASDGAASTSSTTTTTATTSTAAAGGPGGGGPGGGGPGGAMATPEGQIPEETNGPYPADGTNGVDVLSVDGIVREDLTSSFGGATGVADGVPFTIELEVTDVDGKALVGYGVYVWHCTAAGGYSMYSSGIEDENYLRGVQPTDQDGVATFTTIFPACYDGRWPHVHFEVYESVASATSGGERIATSQIALPEDICAQIYGDDERYSASTSNLSRVSLETDNVFSDSYEDELGTISGSADDGLTVHLAVPLAV